MKTFVIKENFSCDGGHRITIVKAENKEQALILYTEHTHRSCLPSWVDAEEITEQITVVCHYNNPNYEG
jgi:hypothetical protein